MLGFVILSHQHQAQLLRLIATLNRLYDDPPIACHHDFGQSSIRLDAFPANVRFVSPHAKTGWGKWGVVEGALRALALLYEDGGPDWFTLLSAADYPVRPARDVLAELAAAPVDAFIDYREICDGHASARRFGPGNVQLAHYESEYNRQMKWARYIGAQIWLPIGRKEHGRWRPGRRVPLPFAAPFGPFSDELRCFDGDHWFTANRKVASLLLEPTPRHIRLQRHLKRRTSPDECYYQTVICNQPGLRLCRNNKRFADWAGGGGTGPRDLISGDLNGLIASGAHFARKFRPGSRILDQIDEYLRGAPSGGAAGRSDLERPQDRERAGDVGTEAGP